MRSYSVFSVLFAYEMKGTQKKRELQDSRHPQHKPFTANSMTEAVVCARCAELTAEETHCAKSAPQNVNHNVAGRRISNALPPLLPQISYEEGPELPKGA